MTFDSLRQDVRFAVRSLRLRSGVAGAAVVTLALGIGAATAVFSVVDGVLLKPLPVTEQDRLLVVWKTVPDRAMQWMPFSYASFEEMRARLRTVSGVAAHPYYGSGRAVVYRDGEPVAVQVTGVTGDWFDVLGAQPLAGRLLAPADDRLGAEPVIVLSPGAAMRLFGGTRDAVGRRLRLDRVSYTVVGIAPQGFRVPGQAEAWAPATPFFTALPEPVGSLREATRVSWYLVVRVAAGFTVDQTRAELAAALATSQEESAWIGEQSILAPALADVVLGEVRPGLLVLGGAVLLVLLIAGFNVANLLIVRGVARGRELAVRSAMGASRARIARQLGTESVVLVVAGAALGLLVAHGALRILLALAPAELPRLEQIGIDGRTLAFTAGTGLVVAVLFGVLPALRTANLAQRVGLRFGGDGAEPGTRTYWLRHGLVVAQVAITALVLSTAGLLLRSLDEMQRLQLGFAADGIALVEVDLPGSTYERESDHQRAMVRLAERAAALPGVRSASAVLTPPFAGNSGFDAIWYGEGQSADAASNPYTNYEGVDAEHFSTIGVPIVAGRGIVEADRDGSPLVVVVNESFAQRYWPGENAVGRRIKGGSPDAETPWRTVVGIAADTRYRELVEPRLTVYVPYGQGIPVRPRYIAVRMAGDVGDVATPIRRIVAEEEPGAAVVGITSLPRLLDAPLARPRFQSALIGAFALLALALSIVGTYAVLAFFVRQRTREIGIRMALGADAATVRRFVLRQGLAICGAGVLIGITTAAAGGRLLDALLFGVRATDPLVLSATAAVLVIATVIATLLPTRVATSTDPMLVMRSD